MKSSRRRTLVLTVLAFTVGLDPGGPAFACGPFPPRARFWHDRRPGPPLEAFLRGELGVLDRSLPAAYFFVAYRHLSGLGLDAESASLLKSHGEEPTAGESRVELPGEIRSGVAAYKEIQRSEGGYVYSSFFRNCLDDAFATAARTYRDRSTQLAPDEWQGWVQAQAQVFAFCGGDGVIPRALPASASPLARADREYQIASAHFYAGSYDEARRRFAAIATDAASPWRAISRYLEEFLRFSQMVPVEVGYDDGGVLFGGTQLEAYADGRPLLSERAASTLNRFFTPTLLLRAMRTGLLAPDLERQLAIASWTRAVLLQDEKTALELVPFLSNLEPRLAGELEAYASAPAGEERVFSASLIMLKFPGLSPFVDPELARITPVQSIDDFRHNWWCGSGRLDEGGDTAPSFLNSEVAEATSFEPAPIHLGRRVLSFVGAHPDDARAPEALHLVVRSTRYGCREGETDFGEVSKEAFQALHRRFPDSPWAEKTKYWYR